MSEREAERRQVQLDSREERRRAAIDRVFDSLLDSLISDQELDSDAAVMKARKLNSAIGRLQFALEGTEQWVIDWLSVEHQALGIIQTAAKIRKKRPDAATDEATRARLLGLYVLRANALSQRILEYEAAGRSEVLAREWEAEAVTYVADPLGTGVAD